MSDDEETVKFAIRVPQNAKPGQKIELKAPNAQSSELLPTGVRHQTKREKALEQQGWDGGGQPAYVECERMKVEVVGREGRVGPKLKRQTVRHGDEFTPALKAAWAEIYGVIATTMIKGAKYNEKSDEEYYKGYAKPADAKGEELTKKSMVSAMDWFMSPTPQSRPLPVEF